MIGIIVALVWVGCVICDDTLRSQCLDCTLRGNVWCPQQANCVGKEEECDVTGYKIKWFKEAGSCNLQPVSSHTECPDIEVTFDQRLGTLVSGNMIMVPVQPRLLVFDSVHSDQEYVVGGYFSRVPSTSLQQPEFFSFSQAVDRFVATLHFDIYSSSPPDDFSENATQVIQFLDLTIVGNVNQMYGFNFVVARKGNNTNSTCAFTPTLDFQQTPTYEDFLFTLGAVGLVIFLVGTFALVNFMLYFNKLEREEHKKGRVSDGEKPLLESTSSADSDSPTPPDDSPSKASIYFSKLKMEGVKFVQSFAMSDKDLLTNYGITLYHYIWFHRMSLIYITACSFVAACLALPTDLIGGTNRDVIAGDFATSTIASLSFTSSMNVIHFLIVVINVSISVVLVWTLRKRSFAIVVAEEQEALPAHEFAVEISGLPIEMISQNLLQEHFEHVYGKDRIISSHVPLVYGPRFWELEELKEKKAQYDKQFEKTKKRPKIFEHFWHFYDSSKKVDAIDFYEGKINLLMQELKFTNPNRGTGYAYVTFTDREIVRVCLKHNNHSIRWDWYRRISNIFKPPEKRVPNNKVNPHLSAPHAAGLNCRGWSVAPAPVPSEINWKNLENSKKTKAGLQTLALVVEVVVLISVLSVTMLFAFIEVARDLYLTDIFYTFGGASILESIASLTIVVLPEAVAIIEEIVAPVVETIEERAGHIHRSGWRRTVMWHTAFFELMSGLVISRMIYFLIGVAVLYDADAPLNSYHYLFNKTGMDMMKYLCIKTFTVYGIKYPALCLLTLVQAKMKGEFQRPDFDYYDLYAQKIVTMFCVVVYGSVMPLILPLGVMYLGISFLYDKWAIVNFHRKDTLHDNRLLFYAADICSFYFTITPLATLLIISKLFIHWPVLATLLIVFSGVIGIVMIETRRWQYMNQNIKGVRKIIKVSDHTLAGVLSSASGDSSSSEIVPAEETVTIEEGEDEVSETKLRWQVLAVKTKHVLRGVARGLREGVLPGTVERGMRTEEDILRTAYVHPLSKDTS